jgi:YVTN family beta-propeller protein
MPLFSRPIGLLPMQPLTYLNTPERAGTTPDGFAYNNPTGRRGLVAVDKVGGKVRFYDPTSFKEIAVLDADKLPHEVAIAPDHRTAYVSIYGPGIFGNNPNPAQTIMMIDLESRMITGSISVAPYFAPHGMMVAPDGRLWVSCDSSAKLVVVNPQSKAVEEAFDTGSTGSHWITMTPDGGKIYISNKTAAIGVFDVARRKLVKSIELPSAKQGTEGIAVSPDGKRILAVDNHDARIHVIDTATDTVVESVALQGNPPTNPKRSRNMRIRFSLDGKFVVTANFASGVIYIHDATNLAQQIPMVVAKGPMGFAFAPDLRTAIVANHDSGIATVFDMTERRILGYFDGGSGIETLTYF